MHSLENRTGEATGSLVCYSDHRFIWFDGNKKKPLFVVKFKESLEQNDHKIHI
jgi:hypothetical protein